MNLLNFQSTYLLFSVAIAVAPITSTTADAKPHKPKAEAAAKSAPTPKEQVTALIKSLETGDSTALSYLSPSKYIQHNPWAPDGIAGFKGFVASLPKGKTKANTVRVFQDGDFVFSHNDTTLYSPQITIDVFRFEGGKIVEHWDNLQDTPAKPNPAGHTMTDGPTAVADLDKTEANKKLVRSLIEDVFMSGKMEQLASYFQGDKYIQHNFLGSDGVSGLGSMMQLLAKQGKALTITKIHRVLGEGNFVLVMSEGSFGGKPTAFFDLFRVEAGKIAEHWDVIQEIPPKEQWKNANGKF